MRREHSRYVKMSYSGDDESNAGKPLVKVRTNVRLAAITRQTLAKLTHITDYYRHYTVHSVTHNNNK